MVGRQLTTETPLVAVDLDGTFTRGNTLHLFARCALTDALCHLRLDRFFRISALLLLRRLSLISHIRMKNGILKAALKTTSFKTRFREKVEAMISPQTERLLADYRAKGYQVVLATAASEIYVPWIWSGDYLATPPFSIEECRGERKRGRVLDYARRHGYILRAVLTDHHDDLPLLAVDTLTDRILLSPTEKTLSRIRTHNLPVTLLHHKKKEIEAKLQ